MEDLLYLDTARIGRPTPKTLHAATDSLLLAAQEGGSAYFDQFLRHGIADCPDWMTTRYSGLHTWRGIGPLKDDLRSLVGVTNDFPVLLANRSAQLMEFAARLFHLRCRNVLTCDLGWPVYQELLERNLSAPRKVTQVPLRDMVFDGRATADEVVDMMFKAYTTNQCDGLFLPAISNLGVRLPIQQIVRRIESSHAVRLVVIDGAQEFSQMGANLVQDYCDLYLAGCHKWLAAYHPMGIGFFGRRRSRGVIQMTLSQLLEAREIDDPLLRYTQRIEGGNNDNYTETVSLSSLFTCQAAVAEFKEGEIQGNTSDIRIRNRKIIADLMADSPWQARHVDGELQSGILMANTACFALRNSEAAHSRSTFRKHGIGLTTYTGGDLRISLPSRHLSNEDERKFKAAIQAV